jgi:Zn-dependent membrane protease YugP
MIGLGLLALQGPIGSTVFIIGIILFSASTIFSLITLPVEYDASNRALAWLETNNVLQGTENDMAADALKWAARTYVVAAISSIATLLYYVMIFISRNRN